jgi:hypothetical protein
VGAMGLLSRCARTSSRLSRLLAVMKVLLQTADLSRGEPALVSGAEVPRCRGLPGGHLFLHQGRAPFHFLRPPRQQSGRT